MARAWALVREFLRELFDFRFSTFLTTRMLPGVYGFGIVLAALFTIYLGVLRFRESADEGLAWLAIGPLMFFGLVTALRITLEFVLAVFRVAWYVEQVAGHTEVVSKELPRFGFLRGFLFGKKEAPPPPNQPPPR
ncbi:MAG: DUF4282 domain-containing protein [Gammaproteobacteria bacterium]